MENKDYTLLVVDDEEANRDILSRRLERKGFNVLIAEYGERALEVVQNHPVDLVLLDIMMPGIDGIEVLKIVRKSYSQNELPVIMVTAEGESEIKALDLGANDYVTKPFDFKKILARVQSQLRGKAAAAQAAVSTEPKAAELKEGAVLAGRYRLGKAIGAGTFGAVYRAKHIELETDLAIKILQTGVTATEDSLTRFRREGVSACRIRHPNAVMVSDFGVTEGGVAFLVMELLEGCSLAEEVRDRGPLSPARVNEILQPICDVLAEAHARGIIHRDIKPENAFLHRTPRGEVVKVLDFGIAKLVGDTVTSQNLTAEGFILGTPAYMAPERLVNEPYDGRSDVYSLGIMLFLMLTGRLPFVAKTGDPMSLLMMHVNDEMPTLRSINPHVPAELEAVIARATRKMPVERPDAAGLAREFAQAVAAAAAAPAPAHAAIGTMDRAVSREVPAAGDSAAACETLQEVDPSAPTTEFSTTSSPAATQHAEPGMLGRLVSRLRKPSSDS
ncbi:MAG: response regulator [bacterium]|nr:response regulator [bacterium]